MIANCETVAFNDIKEKFKKKKANFVIERKRGNSMLFINKKLIASRKQVSFITKDIQLKKEVLNLLGQVQKSINRHLIKKDFTIPVLINDNSSTWRNISLFNSLPVGERLFHIDINHCFWRIAFLHELISERLYKSILDKEHLKTYRNMSLACIIAEKTREYYSNGELKNTISEDRSLYQTIYNNVRFTAYNLCGKIRKDVGDDFLVSYRTDGFVCFEDVLSRIQEIILENNFSCKITECKKFDTNHIMLSNGKIKQF